MNRKIIHIDLDAFYVSVEILKNPKFKNLPVAVCGTTKRSVISSCNYIARNLGIKSAMSYIKAKKICSNLIVLNSSASEYNLASKKFISILRKYTNKVEQVSCDEAYLDVTNNKLYKNSATILAKKIRFEIYQQTSLIASAGISSNKLVAKIASNYCKPNNLLTIKPNEIEQFLDNLDLKKIPGIGKKTLIKLNLLGFFKVVDLKRADFVFLKHVLGSLGQKLYFLIRGVDQSEVLQKESNKSISFEKTYPSDIYNNKQALDLLDELCQKLRINLAKLEGKSIKSIGIKVKYFDFKAITRQEKNKNFNTENIKNLFLKTRVNNKKSIRLLGVFAHLKDKDLRQKEFKF